MGKTRVELNGRLCNEPVLRATPSGRALLRLTLDCGEEGMALALAVVLLGEQARALASALKIGQELSVVGSLRGRSGADGPGSAVLEVLAHEVRILTPCPNPGVSLAAPAARSLA